MRVIGIVCLVIAVLAASGCSERRSPVETSDVHPQGWVDPASANFHGDPVRANGPGSCRGCHGDNLRGAPGEIVGCFACHEGPSGHPEGWVRRSSPDFHGNTVAAMGPSACRDCHGADYASGWSDVACYSCHGEPPGGHPPGQCGHPVGWMNEDAPGFHGNVAFEEGVEECTRCHGVGLGGGTSGVACADCHGGVPAK